MLYTHMCEASVDPLNGRKCYQTTGCVLNSLQFVPFDIQVIPSVASYSSPFLIALLLE